MLPLVSPSSRLDEFLSPPHDFDSDYRSATSPLKIQQQQQQQPPSRLPGSAASLFFTPLRGDSSIEFKTPSIDSDSLRVDSDTFAEQLFTHLPRTEKERAIRNIVSLVVKQFLLWDEELSYCRFKQKPFRNYTALHSDSTKEDIQFQLASSFSFAWEREGCKSEQELKDFYTNKFGVKWDDVTTNQTGKNESKRVAEMAPKTDN